MPRKGIGMNKNALPSWKIERKYSLSNFVEDWLEEKRRLQKDKIIDYGIYSRYQVPQLFADLPKKKTSYAHMEKCKNDVEIEEKFPHCKEFTNGKINRLSPVRIPVPNDLYKLRYKHRPNHHAWNPN
ncbi:hypothetical protein OS493_001575 [Desmophyllum pertusum]|uniref:Uncharacterized protein n=1 Tax=Desmophyllum pertusum TaxID=174260 RepID=A0A9W9ZI83_9CNID|nr:hypothetical protein OS493_001575 [Desmophyllum pertusum]